VIMSFISCMMVVDSKGLEEVTEAEPLAELERLEEGRAIWTEGRFRRA